MRPARRLPRWIARGGLLACASCTLFVDFDAYHAEAGAVALDDGGGGDGSDGGDGGCGDTSSDSANCGACGRDCRGARCSAGLCLPEVVYARTPAAEAVAYTPMAIGLDSEFVYVLGPSQDSANGYVARVDKRARAVDPVAVATNCQTAVSAEVAGGLLFWTQQSASATTSGIGSVATSGRNAVATLLVANQVTPALLATDGTFVFWNADLATAGRGSVWRARISGPAAPLEIAPGAGSVGLAVDDERVYWTSRATKTVSSAAKDGSDVRVLASNQEAPAGIASDGEHVYWVERSRGVFRVPRGGGAVETVAERSDLVGILRLFGEHVYFETVHEILRASKTGGPVLLLATRDLWSALIQVDADHVYWVDGAKVLRTAR